jgi:hypothetical protein
VVEYGKEQLTDEIKKLFEGAKDITFTDTTVTIHSAVKDETVAQIKNLAKEIL